MVRMDPQEEEVRHRQKDSKTVDYTIEIRGYVAEPLAQLFRNRLLQKAWSRWAVLIAFLLIALGILLLGAYCTVDSWWELLFYGGFVLFSVGTGGIGRLLIAFKPTSGELAFTNLYSPGPNKIDHEFREHRQQFLELARETWLKSFRSWRRIGKSQKARWWISLAGSVHPQLVTYC